MSKPCRDFPHLRAEAREQLTLPDHERIRLIKAGGWIGLKHAKLVLAKFEELLDHPRVTRMPSYLLVGPSYSGKTSILEQFLKLHPPDISPDLEATVCPIVMIDAPPKPDLSEFYASILDALMVPYKPTSPTHEKLSQVKRHFRELSVKVLIIDEIHHLIAGSLNRQREFRNALKSLSNVTKVCIIASGIEEAYNAFNADPQMSSRFVPIEMPRWNNLEDKGVVRDLGDLMVTLESRNPLRKASGLHTPGLLLAILTRSEGMLGDICDLVQTAAIDAIRTGAEQITEEQLAHLDWIPPSKRRMYRRPTSMPM